jgi:hypothetical protein
MDENFRNASPATAPEVELCRGTRRLKGFSDFVGDARIVQDIESGYSGEQNAGKTVAPRYHPRIPLSNESWPVFSGFGIEAPIEINC